MIKILILLAIIILSTAIGILLSAEKVKRTKVFDQLYEFNESLILNMKYAQLPISKVVKGYEFIQNSIEGNCPLEGDDRSFIQSYLEHLGASDVNSQVDYLNERKALIKKYKEESASDCKKYRSLYVKVFFMIGVLIAILLV